MKTRKTRLDQTALVAALYATLLTLPAMGGVIYDSIPSPQPPNVASWGYEATSTSEFGGLINFAGTYRDLTKVTVLMSDWALASTYGSLNPTWEHPLTFNLYNVDNTGTNPAPGSLIQSVTQTFDIPWRPAASTGCGTAWRAANGQCYNGLAFTVTFDFTGTTVPDQIIYGLSFNTADYGAVPTHTPGPYNSLNFGLNTGAPSVGSNPFPDTAYWNTAYARFYTDLGAGGVGTFRQDTNWKGQSGAVSFETPEPATCLLFGTGLLCVGLVRRRRRIENR